MNILRACILLFFPALVCAQDDAYVPSDIDKRKWNVSATGIIGSSFVISDRNSSLDFFRTQHGKTSKLLNSDFTGYAEQQIPDLAFLSRVSLQLCTFPFRKADTKEMIQKEFRSELSFGSGEIRTVSLDREDHTLGDTFLYNGQLVYPDTVLTSRYSFLEKSSDLSLSAGFVFFTPVDKRIHFSGGAGLEIGGGFLYSGISGIYREEKNVDYSDAVGNRINKNLLETKTITETLKTKPYTYFRLFFPVTLDFRLSKKNELMKHFYLFFQGSFALDLVTGNNTFLSRNTYGAGGGIRYRLFVP